MKTFGMEELVMISTIKKPTKTELIKNLPHNLVDKWKSFDHTVIGIANSPIEERVRSKFALVAFAGVTAIQVEVLPWTEIQVIESTKLGHLSPVVTDLWIELHRPPREQHMILHHFPPS